MKNKIKSNFLKVSQPIGDFYCCVMSAKDLYNISFSDVRRLESEQEDGFDTYLGIQRELSRSRVNKLKDYISSVDATFPNSIIVAIDAKHVLVNNNELEISYHDDQKGKIAKILDGQHRLAGFEGTDFCYESSEGIRTDFEVLVTMFIEADLHTQAQVFTMVNQNQTKVNKSLVYDLESLALARSPTRSAHQIAVLLNSKKDSPFYKRIKRLGLKTIGVDSELITQAAFVENLVKLISRRPNVDRDILLGKKKKFLGLKDSTLPDSELTDYKRLPFRKSFIDSDDSSIAANIYNYFLAIEEKWPTSWDYRNKKSVLNKTVGLIALMRLLRDITNILIMSNEIKYGDVISKRVYMRIIKMIDVEDSYFSEVDAVSKTSGLIYKKLREKI